MKVWVTGLVFLGLTGPFGCGGDDADPLGVDGNLSALNDDFTSASSLSQWTVRSDAEGHPSDGAVEITGGQLVLRPHQNHYFYNEHRGLSLYKTIVSSAHPRFVIETQVRATDRATGGAPTEDFHSAGLVIYPNLDDMRDWVVGNIGYQNEWLGFEDKTTVDDRSVLTLYPSGGADAGQVRICMIDNAITVFTRLNGAAAWTERNSFTHAVGAQMGAGVMINDYLMGSAEVNGVFEYVRFAEVSGIADCRA